MRRGFALLVPLLAVALLVVAACGGTPKSDTPEEFVAAMRKAYERKDVDAIMALTADPSLPPKGAGPPAEEKYDRERDREDTEIEMKRNGMWYRAWKSTTFESAREHGDHVHVTVAVANTRSEVVLVRQDGVLKIHPEPSSFD